MSRWRCGECYCIAADGELLTAPNPFDTEQEITGCHKCAAVNSFTMLCDVDGCEGEVTCGWPNDGGYRRTCFRHYKEGKP